MRRLSAVSSIVTVAGLLGAGCGAGMPDGEAEPTRGAPLALGNDTVDSYAEFDASGAPEAIGVAFSGQALADLPERPSDGHRCYDADGDERIDLETECAAWHEFVLPLPDEAARHPDVPFEWALVNWNPHGHIPPGVWDVPHFDVHFYIERIEKIFSLRRGTCGPEFLRCDQYEVATQPVPPNYIHPDYEDVGAAAPAMGNHLIDPTAPEFDGEPFTRHWIFGAYGGEVIFYEEMVALDYLRERPDACFDIKTPEAVAVTGYYPRRSCIRYDAARDEYTVSMEDFDLREASPPAPILESEVQG